MMDLTELKATLVAEARRQGFETVGVTTPDSTPSARGRLLQFLADGQHGDMQWLETSAERRCDPHSLWPEARSIIMLGLNYGPDHDPLAILTQRDRGAVSVYAQGDDYHELIKPRLKSLARWLVARAGGDVK